MPATKVGVCRTGLNHDGYVRHADTERQFDDREHLALASNCHLNEQLIVRFRSGVESFLIPGHTPTNHTRFQRLGLFYAVPRIVAPLAFKRQHVCPAGIFTQQLQWLTGRRWAVVEFTKALITGGHPERFLFDLHHFNMPAFALERAVIDAGRTWFNSRQYHCAPHRVRRGPSINSALLSHHLCGFPHQAKRVSPLSIFGAGELAPLQRLGRCLGRNENLALPLWYCALSYGLPYKATLTGLGPVSAAQKLATYRHRRSIPLAAPTPSAGTSISLKFKSADDRCCQGAPDSFRTAVGLDKMKQGP